MEKIAFFLLLCRSLTKRIECDRGPSSSFPPLPLVDQVQTAPNTNGLEHLGSWLTPLPSNILALITSDSG